MVNMANKPVHHGTIECPGCSNQVKTETDAETREVKAYHDCQGHGMVCVYHYIPEPSVVAEKEPEK
jgi:hypothetical protein